MRPVRSRSRTRGTAKPRRRSARGVSRASQPSYRRRGRGEPGVFERLWLALRAVFTWRNPAAWLIAAVAFVVVAATLIEGGYVERAGDASRRAVGAVMADAGFGISSIRIEGNARTDPKEILAALGFAPGQSIFEADVRKARHRLLSLEWVADAEVRRQYPGLVTVSIVEKQPFALFETQDGTYVVERSGRTIGMFDPQSFPHLPVLLGEGAPQSAAPLVDAVSAHRAVAARVVGYARISDRRWNLLFGDGVVVKLPEDGWQKQLDLLEHLIVDKSILERDISEIDLRVPDTYFFVLRNGQKQQSARGNAT